jgi:hypothetical protein
MATTELELHELNPDRVYRKKPVAKFLGVSERTLDRMEGLRWTRITDCAVGMTGRNIRNVIASRTDGE